MVGGVKEKITSLFKTKTPKDYNKPTPVNNVFRGEKKPRKLNIENNLKTT